MRDIFSETLSALLNCVNRVSESDLLGTGELISEAMKSP
jgi:hypothetical protein